MREIKVRGYSWEKITGDSQWLYGYGVTEIEFAEHYAKEKKRESDVFLISEYGDYQVHKESVGEYTGLKDRDGMEIYEGDIVLFDSKVYPVTFKNGNFGVNKLMRVNLYTDDMREYQEPLWNLVVDGCEVIGNVYENSELLEDEVR